MPVLRVDGQNKVRVPADQEARDGWQAVQSTKGRADHTCQISPAPDSLG